MRTVRVVPLLPLLIAAACSDSTGPSGPRPARGVVVLNSSQSQGLTLLDTAGASPAFVAFDYPDYDGGGMTLVDDTVLTTSSKGGGDLLFVADLRTGSVVRYQMPAGSNPGAAMRDPSVRGNTTAFLVALRDSNAVASVRVTRGVVQPVITLMRDAGLCPVDVAKRGSDTWSLDANADCRSTYDVQGPARLIRLAGAARDTLALPATARGSAGAIVVVADTAWVATSGEADFSNFPNTEFTVPGRLTKVNLATRTVIASRGLPAGTYGAGMKRGADGRFYLTAYTSTDFSKQDVFAIDAGSLEFTGTRIASGQSLDLRKATDGRPSCTAATADAAGTVYCVEVDYGSAGASTVYVFGADGVQRRQFLAGQYAADIDIR